MRFIHSFVAFEFWIRDVKNFMQNKVIEINIKQLKSEIRFASLTLSDLIYFVLHILSNFRH